jgi:NAD(P)-dependent dehydrogenase (short-subunit alcohol dehydrogenase family)
VKVAVITGASSGIGASAAGSLAAAGWNVAVVGRNRARTRDVAEAVGGIPFVADYDRLDDVRELAASLAERFGRIDVLANNAGGLVHERGESADGFERTIQHNHLAPFLLTTLLLPCLEPGARVIATASVANTFGDLRLDDLDFRKRHWQGGWRAYGTSKIATILFTRELARRTALEAYAYHPGYVATSFGADSPLVKFANLFRPGGTMGISAEQGAAPLVHLATTERVDAPNGTYFDGFKPNGRVHRSADVPGAGEALWAESARMVGLA